MASKPSLRTNRIRPAEGLNLTPFIDMVTCLMFFLLMFAGIIPVVIIDAPLPKIASTAEEVKKAKDTNNKLEVMVQMSPESLTIKAEGYGSKSFAKAPNGDFNWDEFRKHLIQLHARKPDSREITLMPNDDVNFDLMIQVMDEARELKKGDTGYQNVPPEIAAKPESAQFNRLFPDVSIGGV